jgi:hypothetical protein
MTFTIIIVTAILMSDRGVSCFIKFFRDGFYSQSIQVLDFTNLSSDKDTLLSPSSPLALTHTSIPSTFHHPTPSRSSPLSLPLLPFSHLPLPYSSYPLLTPRPSSPTPYSLPVPPLLLTTRPSSPTPLTPPHSSPTSYSLPLTPLLPPTHSPSLLQVAEMLPAKKQRYKSTITDLSPKDKTVTLADGTKIKYNKVEWCSSVQSRRT